MPTMGKRLDPQNNICCLIFQLEHSLVREIMDSLSDVGITALQLEVLADLAIEPGLSTADLARYTHVTPQNMSLAVSQLLKKGLVARHTDRTNARIHRLEVTKRGRAVFDRADALSRKVEKRVFGDLSAAQQKSLRQTLQHSLTKFES